MLDHFIATNATAHKVNSYYTLAISYCTFCVGKCTILGPVLVRLFFCPFISYRVLTRSKKGIEKPKLVRTFPITGVIRLPFFSNSKGPRSGLQLGLDGCLHNMLALGRFFLVLSSSSSLSSLYSSKEHSVTNSELDSRAGQHGSK